MKITVENLNKLYMPVFIKIDKLTKFLGSHCVEHALDFQYGHSIKIKQKFNYEMYPIPTFRCKFKCIKAEICLDVFTNKNYIGYFKLYPSKEEILSIDLSIFANLKYLIYGYNYQQELYNSEDLTQTKINIENSKDTKFIIYVDFKNLEQIFYVIESLTEKPSQRFSMANYKCDCGHYITIDANGSCPICGKESTFKRKIATKCLVCGTECLKDQFGNGECDKCGWILNSFGEKYPARAIHPNLISVNKAKKLYSEGKPFEPNLDDFIEALYSYSEMQFEYKGVYYAVTLVDNGNDEYNIELYNEKTKEATLFNNDEDFKNNAKVEDNLLKDIWEETTDRYWLQ